MTPNIKIISPKKSDSTFLLSLFFEYSQNSHFYAHLYDHLFFRLLGDKYRVKGEVGSGILKIIIEGKMQPRFLSRFLLLEDCVSKDIEVERSRIVLETLSYVYGHRWLVHNLIQYQQKNKNLLLKHIRFLKNNFVFEKEEIFKNLKLTHAVIYAPSSIGKNFKKVIDEIATSFSLKRVKKNTLLRREKKPPGKDFVFPAYSIVVPISSVIEAYKLVLIAKIFKEEVEKKLIKKGIAYNCQLEINKDFTRRIFSTLISLVDLENYEKFFNIAEKLVKNPPVNKKIFEETKKKLIEELNEKNKHSFLKLEDEIMQKLEWGTTKPLSVKRKIELVKKINLENLYDWWRNKVSEGLEFTLFY
jgi:hypothetical protein